MKKVIFVLFLSFLFFSANAQSLEQKIEEMIELSGASRNFDIVVDQLISFQKLEFGEIDDEYWISFKQALQDSVKDQLISSIVPIYAKYLSEGDVDEIIRFYQSDAGQNLVNNQPNIMKEAGKNGQLLGEKTSRLIIDMINAKKLEQFNQEYPACELAKTGKFVAEFNNTEVTFIRKKTKQLEYYQNIESKYAIRWLSDSRYELKFLSTNDPNLNREKGETMVVNIIECFDFGYKYLARQNGFDKIMEGEMLLKKEE